MNGRASAYSSPGGRRRTAFHAGTVPASERKAPVCGRSVSPPGGGQPGSRLGRWMPVGAGPSSPSMNRYDGHLALGWVGGNPPGCTAACSTVPTTATTLPWPSRMVRGAGSAGPIWAFAWRKRQGAHDYFPIRLSSHCTGSLAITIAPFANSRTWLYLEAKSFTTSATRPSWSRSALVGMR